MARDRLDHVDLVTPQDEPLEAALIALVRLLARQAAAELLAAEAKADPASSTDVKPEV